MKPLVGIGMVGMGVVMVFGGITGRLAPMLAALFYPSGLTQGGGGGSGIPNPFMPWKDVPSWVPFASQPVTPATPAPVQVNPYVNPGAKVVTT